MTIVITGGTGTLGSHLVPLLTAAGHRVRVLSRQHHPDTAFVEYVRGDLETGAGLDEMVRGATTVIHGAGSAKRDALKAKNLVSALQNSGDTAHLVFISVVGADSTPFRSAIDRATLGYFEQKQLAEREIVGSGIPWSILRATQFNDFFVNLADLAKWMPVVPSFAGFHYQPVDARDVAARLAHLALGTPTGLIEELGGPRTYPMEVLLRDYLRARGRRRVVVPMRVPGAAAKAQRAGANLTPEHADGVRTWEAFIDEVESQIDPKDSDGRGAAIRRATLN